MVIFDLNYWEDIAETASIVGGSKKEEVKKKILDKQEGIKKKLLAKKAKIKESTETDAAGTVSVRIKNIDGAEISVESATVSTSISVDL